MKRSRNKKDKKPVPSQPDQTENTTSNVMERFERERQRMHDSVKKLVGDAGLSSSDEEDVEYGSIMRSLLENFERQGGRDLGKTQAYLDQSFQSGAGVCLICIETVKRLDAVWNCGDCFGCFHLVCIQRWAQGNIFHQKQAMEELPVFQRTAISWGCPKCRCTYKEGDIPNRYFCYCKKVQDPPPHPWLVPHSCGETCDRLLQPDCGHRCLLLCHPGPCPPCPKTVRTGCYCGQSSETARRCSDKFWSCGRTCGKLLACRLHKCEANCHAGECADCPRQSVQSCDCSAHRTQRPCAQPTWKCNDVCGKPFGCGFHKCEVRCHPGACGDCPLTLQRTCPCGKTQATVSCTQEIPTCNDTCGRMMECGQHTCQLKCHRDKCGCLEIVRKQCRCGKNTKELPCGKEYLCESKCKSSKVCQRHICNRKCCDGQCPPCEKPCGRSLPCGAHKCASMCHRGSCYPCPLTATVRCRCGGTGVTVPCGREKRTRPPRCNKPCMIPPDCRHPKREPHRCHAKECPPCRQVCGRERASCPHPCGAACHTAVLVRVDDNKRPAGPWEVTEPTYKRVAMPCPPCPVPVPVTCLGEHETVDWGCSEARRASCGRQCGRRLRCSNHVCSLPCHSVVDAADATTSGSTCEFCNASCGKPRPEGCSHGCPRQCHPGDCPPCDVEVKLKCYCAIAVVYLPCVRALAADESESALSCGNSCPKSYPCGHKCRDTCHKGECTGAESCRRKVKSSCPCGRIKKEFPCDVMRRGEGSVTCDEACAQKLAALKQKKEAELQQKALEEEKKNQEELEKFQKKFEMKKKTRERRRIVEEVEPSFFFKYRFLLIGGAVAAISGIIYQFLLSA